MGCFLGVIGKLHNDECLIYIFTWNVENVTPIIFNRILYPSWYKELRTHFSPILINTLQKNVHFKNHTNGKISNSGLINPHELCYHCSKHGPDFLFGKSRNKDFNDEPHFPNDF